MVNAIHSLTAREAQIYINRRNYATTDFCTQYNCSADQLKDHIKTLFASGSSKVLRQLSANDKKTTRLTSSTHNAPPPVAVFESSTPTANSVAPERLKAIDEEIIALHQQIEDIKRTYDLELHHYERNIKELRQLHSDLAHLKKQVQDKIARFRQLNSDNSTIVSTLQGISDQRCQAVAQISRLEDESEELRSITIGVYNAGNIEVFDHPEINPDDTGYDQVYHYLLDQEACQDLRLSELRLIARTICVIRNSSVKLIPLFENENLQRYFDLFKAV